MLVKGATGIPIFQPSVVSDIVEYMTENFAGIPIGTLHRFAVSEDRTPRRKRQKTQAYLSPQQEEDLAIYCSYMAERGWPLITDDIRELGQEIAASSQSQFQQAEVSLRWAQRFVKRKRLALRTPKSKHGGQTSVKETDVDNYFGLLNDRVSAWGLWEKPGNIVNMDESGWGKDEQFRQKVVVGKGQASIFKRQVFAVDHVTSVHCVSASGENLPTMLIYKNGIPQLLHGEGLPTDWVFTSSDTGYMTRNIFFHWMKLVLVPWSKRREGRVLLLLDNAQCHYSVEAIQMAIDNGIEILSLPPNTSSFLQPLDQLFSVLKLALYTLAARYSITSGGFIVNKSKFVYILKHAISETLTSTKIMVSFASTGIFPFDPYTPHIKQARKSLIKIPPLQDTATDSDTNTPNMETCNQNQHYDEPCPDCGQLNPCPLVAYEGEILWPAIATSKTRSLPLSYSLLLLL